MPKLTPDQFKALQIPGFEKPTGEVEERLTICSFGAPRRGKTDFALRTLPEPIGVLALDINSKALANKHIAEGRQIILSKHDYTSTNRANLGEDVPVEALKFYRARWENIKTDYYHLVNNKYVRSILIDTGTMLYDAARMSIKGTHKNIIQRDNGDINREMIEMMHNVAGSGKSLIVTHEEKEIWENNKSTGRVGPKGTDIIQYRSQVTIQHYTKETKGVPPIFGIRVLDCTDNPTLVGLELEDDYRTFQMLALTIFPSSDPEAWS